MINILGFTAGILTGVALFPQVFKTIKTKSADDISYGMLILSFVGVSCWLVYGILIDKSPVIIANIITTILFLSMIILKRVYSK